MRTFIRDPVAVWIYNLGTEIRIRLKSKKDSDMQVRNLNFRTYLQTSIKSKERKRPKSGFKSIPRYKGTHRYMSLRVCNHHLSVYDHILTLRIGIRLNWICFSFYSNATRVFMRNTRIFMIIYECNSFFYCRNCLINCSINDQCEFDDQYRVK